MPGRTAHPSATPSAPLLYERERELETARSLIERASSGAGGTLLIEGEPGAGKSTLLAAAGAVAPTAGVRRVEVCGKPFDRAGSFGAVHRLARRSGVRDVDLAALATERGPLLLAVDDAQWMDTASASRLTDVAEAVGNLPVALLVATRPQSPRAASGAAALRRQPGVRSARLAALSARAVTDLTARRLGIDCEAEFGRGCHRLTGGNPLLVGEVLDELAAQGIRPVDAEIERLAGLLPRGVQRLIVAALDDLDAACRALTGAVVALAEDASPDAVGALTGFGGEVVDRCADALQRAGILGGGRAPLAFAAPIVRAAAETILSPRERTEWHRRAREVLVAAGAGAERLARNVLASAPAGDPSQVDVLLRAGSAARSRGDLAAAATYLERALREPPERGCRGRVLADLGAVEARAMRATAIDHLHRALQEGALDQGRRAAAARDLAALIASRQPDRAMAALREAAAEAASDGERAAVTATAWGLSLAGRAHRDAFAGDPAVFHATPEVARLQRGLAAALTGTADDALALARAGAGGRLDAELGPETVAHHIPALTLALAGDLDGARQAVERSLGAAEAAGAAAGSRLARAVRSLVLVRSGALSDAAAEPELGEGAEIGTVLAATALLEAAADHLQLVTPERLEAAASAAQGSDGLLGIPALASLARLRLVERRPVDALALLERCAELEAEWDVRTPALCSRRAERALTLAALGRAREASACAARAVADARAFGAARPLGIALRAAGTIDRDLDALHEAVTVLASSGARLEHARAMHELGAALRRRGCRRAARAHLAEALALARACGAASLAQLAAAELRAAGDGGCPRSVPGARDVLTASERRTAALATEGCSNREIARILRISEKTVERHLSSTYRKLGVRRRSQLGAVLAGEDRS